MKPMLRAACLWMALALPVTTLAQDAAPAAAGATERGNVGYMLGFDTGHTIGPGLPELDMPAFTQAFEHALAGGEPPLPPAEARAVSQALMARIGARRAGGPLGELDAVKAGKLVGTTAGHALAGMRGEFDTPAFLRGLSDGAAGKPPGIGEDTLRQTRANLAVRQADARQARQAASEDAARRREVEFLAENRKTRGVFATPSGLQYMILKQGTGPRPKPGDTVRVHYVGTRLDGHKFDSSHDRGEPAEFGLDQVIKGWSEGVAMMPVGAKYRFWVPAALGYGDRGGGPDIPPGSTLVFDVELLGVK